MTVETNEQAIQTDAPLDRDGATDAFIKGWKIDAEEPSKETQGEDPEEQDETTEEPSEDAPEDESEAETEDDESDTDPDNDEDEDSAFLKDNAKVKVTVDGEELEVSVKDLKRLYGQEASLTKKSQAVSEQQKQLVQTQEYVESVLEVSLQAAEEAFAPYKDIDWVVASKRLTEEELSALRDEARKAYTHYEKVNNQINDYVKQKREESNKQLSKLIQETNEVLADAEKGIPGWGKEKYAELSEYAQSLGFPKEAIDTFVTAPVWHLLHKAHQFDKGKQVVTKKVNKSPKNTLKTTKRTTESTKNVRAKEALQRMRDSGGSRDSAVEAFLAKWQD